jgi:glycogen debranching enzyme
VEKIKLKYNDAFVVSDSRGDLPASEVETGLFWHGTRFLRICDLFLADQHPLALSHSTSDSGNSCQIDLMNPALSIDGETTLREGTVHTRRQLELQNHQLIQTIILTSFHAEPITLKLSLKMDVDFKDIFEVRGSKRNARGELFSPEMSRSTVVFRYLGLDNVERKTHLMFTPTADHTFNGEVSWNVRLMKNQPVQIQVVITVSEYDVSESADTGKTDDIEKSLVRNLPLPEISTGDVVFNELLARSIHDLTMMCTVTPQGLYPYGGIPWFVCPFGRDGLITSLEFLPWFPEVARGTLAFLAAYQGTKNESFTDEEPGKILHEFRRGEMANCREIPYIPYYGSIDSTLLFVITLESYIRWTNDLSFLTQLWPHAEAAAYWMINYGDQDGDTFLESRTTSMKGLANQGWKDSWDSISHQDGRLAEAPIALCEVQGYAYAAFRAMNYLASRLGKPENATYWSQVAETLQANFLRRFWWEDEDVFYLALDGSKQPCAVVTSNSGQCLWTGIVPDTLAKKMVTRLMREDMYSGWGIRTLSESAARYNPMSYHNGSIWPHDTAIIGAGFARYGKKEESGRLLENLSQASQYYERARLPELFCGFARSHKQGPIPYPIACEPQSWAAGAPFMLLSAVLGFEPDAENQRLTLHQPTLPHWLQRMELHGLRLGEQRIDLHIERSSSDTIVNLTVGTNVDLNMRI